MDLPRKLLQVNVFVWHDNFVNKFIGDYITNGMNDRIKIIYDMFSDDIFLFIISSVIEFEFPTESGFKHLPSVCCYFMVVYIFE